MEIKRIWYTIKWVSKMGLLDGLNPVSYTHLDVYKRQVKIVLIKTRRAGQLIRILAAGDPAIQGLLKRVPEDVYKRQTQSHYWRTDQRDGQNVAEQCPSCFGKCSVVE